MINITDRRLGRFRVRFDAMNRDPDMVRQAMGRVIVLDCRVLFDLGEMEYIAVCDAFASVRVGEVMPRYEPEFINDSGRTYFRGWRAA